MIFFEKMQFFGKSKKSKNDEKMAKKAVFRRFLPKNDEKSRFLRKKSIFAALAVHFYKKIIIFWQKMAKNRRFSTFFRTFGN